MQSSTFHTRMPTYLDEAMRLMAERDNLTYSELLRNAAETYLTERLGEEVMAKLRRRAEVVVESNIGKKSKRRLLREAGCDPWMVGVYLKTPNIRPGVTSDDVIKAMLEGSEAVGELFGVEPYESEKMPA